MVLVRGQVGPSPVVLDINIHGLGPGSGWSGPLALDISIHGLGSGSGWPQPRSSRYQYSWSRSRARLVPTSLFYLEVEWVGDEDGPVVEVRGQDEGVARVPVHQGQGLRLPS